MRILIVEDEQALADAVARGLRREGMAVDVAYDGDSASEKVLVTRYDVVVLDRDLPGRSGDDICAEIAGGVTRVIMLTASGTLRVTSATGARASSTKTARAERHRGRPTSTSVIDFRHLTRAP